MAANRFGKAMQSIDKNQDLTEKSTNGICRSQNGGKLKGLTKKKLNELLYAFGKELGRNLVYVGPMFAQKENNGLYNVRVEVRRETDCDKIEKIAQFLRKNTKKKFGALRWYKECNRRYVSAMNRVTPGGNIELDNHEQVNDNNQSHVFALLEYWGNDIYPTLNQCLDLNPRIFAWNDNNKAITPPPPSPLPPPLPPQAKHQYHQRHYDNHYTDNYNNISIQNDDNRPITPPPSQRAQHQYIQRDYDRDNTHNYNNMSMQSAMHQQRHQYHQSFERYQQKTHQYDAQQNSINDSRAADFDRWDFGSSGGGSDKSIDDGYPPVPPDLKDPPLPPYPHQQSQHEQNMVYDEQKMVDDEQKIWLLNAMYTEDDLQKTSPHFLGVLAKFENILKQCGSRLNITSKPGQITEEDLQIDPVFNAYVRLVDMTEEENIILHSKYFAEIMNSTWFNLGARTPGYLKEKKTVPAVTSFCKKNKSWRTMQFLCDNTQQLTNELMQCAQ